jgi:hypothetical protein
MQDGRGLNGGDAAEGCQAAGEVVVQGGGAGAQGLGVEVTGAGGGGNEGELVVAGEHGRTRSRGRHRRLDPANQLAWRRLGGWCDEIGSVG